MYGDAQNNSILFENMTHSDYGHAIALSVSYFYMFVRPVGDVLTNQTVREVNHRETGFADEYATTREHLIVVAKGIYELVRAILLRTYKYVL